MRRTWLITGASRGLGRALSEAVLASGDQLVATARDLRALDDIAKRFGEAVRGAPRRYRSARGGRRR